MKVPGALLLMGFGGHARSVADVALAAGYQSLYFVDPNARDGETFLGFPAGRVMPTEIAGFEYMPCAGDNQRRMEQLTQLTNAGLPVATVISPSATIGRGAMIEAGCFVAHQAHIGPLAQIGAGCIVNSGAVVEHDCVVGPGSHISIHASVAGRTRLGRCVFLGAGAVVIDGISVVNNVTIGAGGVVLSAIDEPGTYVGVPVRRIPSRQPR